MRVGHTARNAVLGAALALATVSACGSGGGGPAPSGGEAAFWKLTEPDRVDATTSVVEIAVGRLECASGVTGDVLPLHVEEGEEQVVITATVARNADEDATCPLNDPVVIEVRLEEPIGDRTLVDGGCTHHPDATSTQPCIDPVRWP